MISSEGGDIRVGVIVQIEGREVAISEVVDEQVDEPFPRRRDSGCLDLWQVVLQHLLVDDLAFLVLAQPNTDADLI